jgi:predicted metal-dependent peptidase
MMVMPKEDVTQAEVSKQAERLKKSHIFLMKHPKIMALSGIIIMGTSEVRANIPTAYTDGVNKKYGAGFMAKCTDPQLNGLVMHENGHVFFRHVTHHKRLFRENPKLTNIAADFVVNDMIVLYEDKDIELPPGALWNPMFRNWSVTQVYDYLKKRKEELEDEGEGNPRPDGKPGPQGDGTGPQGNGSPSGETQNKQTDVDELLKRLDDHDSLDEHDHEAGAELDEKQIGEDIDRALRQGGMLAGILGGDKNRQIEELLKPKVDWREVLRDFISSMCRGKDELSWRRFNKRLVANGYYMPTPIAETVGEVVVAIDTSGSIGDAQLSQFAGELASICEAVIPEKVRVVWWDAKVHGEQVFEQNQYASIATLLKPVGGGGTVVSSVSEHLVKHNVQAECVIIFTDGYVEDDVQWQHTAPLLWLITQRRGYEPPVGKSVFVEED